MINPVVAGQLPNANMNPAIDFHGINHPIMPFDKDLTGSAAVAAKGYQTHYPNTTTANPAVNKSAGKASYHTRAYSLEQKSKVYS